MKTCKNEQCSNEVTGKQTYCSDTCRKRTSRTTNSDMSKSDKQVGQAVVDGVAQVSIVNTAEGIKDLNRPPCTPSQMTSPCHACVDHDECSYRKNQTTAVPGDADYKGVCAEVDGTWRVA